MRRIVIVAIAFAPFLLAQPLSAREWVDASGKYRVEAEFIGVENEQVTLKRRDGSMIQVPLAKLSRPDRLHIAERLNHIPNTGDKNPVLSQPKPLVLDQPEFLTSQTGRPSYSVIAQVTTSNNQSIQENSLLPVIVMFNESIDGELTDLTSDPKSLVKTSAAIINAQSDPSEFIIHYSWNVASKAFQVNGKATGAIANFEPGDPKTILYVNNDAASLRNEFGKTPSDGGTWGLFLVDRKLHRTSNVLLFSKADLVEVKRSVVVYAERMKSLVGEPEQQ